jgi:heterogeneous nuclear ribonucleoprotein L
VKEKKMAGYDGHASKRLRTDVEGHAHQSGNRGNPVHVGGSPAYFNYSTSQKIQRQSGDERGNKVLLFTILNPQYPITVDVMHTICSPNGQVLRIVIFKKTGVQAMVEFEDVESARRAKQALNGADIYSGCCTLKIDYAKPTRLNVIRNDSDQWDYTTNNPGADKGGKGQPLLAEPRYGSAPTPYDDEGGPEPPPPRRGPMGHGPHGGYGMDAYGAQSEGYEGYGRMERYGGPPPSRYGPPQDSYGMPPERYGPPGPRGEYQEGPGGPGGMLQQGAVLMIYGLTEKMNCQRVFNLFCLYGNVVRIKFLKSKEGAAMIQMGDQASCERAMKNLNNSFFFGSKMQLGYSKQAYLQDPPNPHDLPDGTPSFVDYMGNRNNRFTTPENAQKNRIQPPAKVLHFFNAPPGITEEQLNKVFTEAETKPPAKVKVFPSKSERSSTGLLEWDSKGDALEGLVLANHSQIPNPNSKNPYVFKLCFSSAPILGQ